MYIWDDLFQEYLNLSDTAETTSLLEGTMKDKDDMYLGS